MSEDVLEVLLRNSSNSLEGFLVLFCRDIAGEKLDLENLKMDDLDRVNGVLKIRSKGGSAPNLVTLRSDTLKAYRKYEAERRDKDSSLIVTSTGAKLTDVEIRDALARIANLSGVEFDRESLGFRPARAPTQRLVTKGASRDMFYLYGIISHPLRRDIVELLGDEGPLGFSQIKKRLNVRVGTLYYHFDMLAGIVSQGADKKYELSAAGRDAYAKLHSTEYAKSAHAISKSLPPPRSLVDRLGRLLVPPRLISVIQTGSAWSIIGAILILATGMVLVYQTRLEALVLLLNPSSLGLYLSPTYESVILEVAFLASWLTIYLVSDGLTTLLFDRRGEHITLLVGSAFSLVPLLVFAAWWDLVTTISLPGGLPAVEVSRTVLILFQAWSLGILATVVARVKGLRLDKAAVVALAIAYLSIITTYVLGV